MPHYLMGCSPAGLAGVPLLCSLHAWKTRTAHPLSTGRCSPWCSSCWLPFWLPLGMITAQLWQSSCLRSCSMLTSPAFFGTSSSRACRRCLTGDSALTAASRYIASSTHLLWRSEWKVRPPPLDSTRASVELCHGGRLKASAHRDKFYPALSKAQGKAKQGDCSALLQLRSKPFDPTTHSNLKLGSTLGNRPTASECQPSQVRMVVLVRAFCYG